LHKIRKGTAIFKREKIYKTIQKKNTQNGKRTYKTRKEHKKAYYESKSPVIRK
jgi:hypothetical protein